MRRVFLISLFLFSLGLTSVCSGEDVNLLVKGRYFSVYAHPGLDINSLLLRLKADHFSRIEGLSSRQGSGSLNQRLAAALDSIF
jgi:hypothetical protein